ncbi:MAG: hypothetical protein V4479_14805 [Actinomycetota bacterium]
MERGGEYGATDRMHAAALAEVQDEAAAAETRLKQGSWADHITIVKLLTNWSLLPVTVATGHWDLDDYVNDLFGRDALQEILEHDSAVLVERIAPIIEKADDVFRAETTTDVHGVIASEFRVDTHDGWWWQRVPTIPFPSY